MILLKDKLVRKPLIAKCPASRWITNFIQILCAWKVIVVDIFCRANLVVWKIFNATQNARKVIAPKSLIINPSMGNINAAAIWISTTQRCICMQINAGANAPPSLDQIEADWLGNALLVDPNRTSIDCRNFICDQSAKWPESCASFTVSYVDTWCQYQNVSFQATLMPKASRAFIYL